MDDWENFNETPLPEEEDFYSHLNMEYITDADYVHTKKVCKDFEILGEYHDLILLIIINGRKVYKRSNMSLYLPI